MRWRAEVSRLMVPVAAPAARRGGLSCARQRRPDVRRHATLPQSWIQRENWEFETHRRHAVRQRRMAMPLRWKTSGLLGSRRANAATNRQSAANRALISLCVSNSQFSR